jgi:fungal nitric oxide reductase
MAANSATLPTFPFARPSGCESPAENARLRHNDPISKVQLFDGSQCWWIGKHRDVCKVLQSDKVSKDRRKPGYPDLHPGGKEKATKKKPTFVDSDDPWHAW